MIGFQTQELEGKERQTKTVNQQLDNKLQESYTKQSKEIIVDKCVFIIKYIRNYEEMIVVTSILHV